MKKKLLIVGLCAGMALVSCKGKDSTETTDSLIMMDSTQMMMDSAKMSSDSATHGSSSMNGSGSTMGGGTTTTPDPKASGTTKSGINNDNAKGGTGAPTP
jgi:hypothetical protein